MRNMRETMGKNTPYGKNYRGHRFSPSAVRVSVSTKAQHTWI